MMKKAALISTLAIFLISANVIAQNKETRELSSFTSISVSEAINVFLTPGSSETARVESNGIDLDEVMTEVRGNELRIYLEKGNYKNIDVDIWVTYKSLNEIEVTSAASVKTEGLLKSSSLIVDGSSAGDADLEIDVDDLDVEVSSSADIDIRGRATKADISVSSAGSFDGFDLASEEVEVDANSAGSAKVNVTKRLNAEATSAGNVRYKGNPEKVYEEESKTSA